ncbi:MAG TPA: uroporphyrinogen-III synthase [Allosphingosinicella sp.]|nr:uroporphyrinogen-III synthase [Allosphingosinicella sp.]
MKLLVLRPEPGASETAARASEVGLEVVVAPLFSITPVAAEPVDPANYDAVLLTSANGARFAPGGLTGLRCFAVGEATAAAARAAGFAEVETGPSDGEAALEAVASSGARRVLHLCGRHHKLLSHPEVRLDRRIVYASDPVAPPPRISGPAVALVHSPRAGARLTEIAEDKGSILIAAISEAAAAAAGDGWRVKAVAGRPRDAALLELAVQLCNHGRVTAREAPDGL